MAPVMLFSLWVELVLAPHFSQPSSPTPASLQSFASVTLWEELPLMPESLLRVALVNHPVTVSDGVSNFLPLFLQLEREWLLPVYVSLSLLGPLFSFRS